MPSFAHSRPHRPRRRNSRAKRIRIDSVSVARHRARAADSRKTDHRAGNVQTDVRYNPRIAGLLNFAFVFDVLNCISHAWKACAAETATSMTEAASRRLRCDWQAPVRETWSVDFGDKTNRGRDRAPHSYALNRRDVCSLHAFGAALRFEADLLAFSEALEAIAANFGEVREKVVAAVIRGDEAEALCVVKPLYSTGIHTNP
jgi:hypothetical protein